MIRLIPDWAIHDEEFWLSIRKRNLWFIKLRYATVVVLFLFLLTYKFFLQIELSKIQSNALITIASIILLYNLSFQYFSKYLKHDSNAFNPLHLSILQMVLDLIMLLMLVHYSGGVDSPIYFFLIFHMIVGSLILPGIIIFSFALAVVISFWGITTGNYFNIFEHHPIRGLLNESNIHNFNYVLSVNIVFAMVIIITVILANNIARQLYQKEQQLYSYIEKLNQAEKEKTKYILGIVHELKTPLNALHAYLDIVLQKFLGPLDETVEEKLIRAKKRSDEAIEMINTILKVSQMKLMDEISYDLIDPEEILKAAILRHEQFANNKSIKIFYFDERKDKSLKIKGDKFLLVIALSNLVGNAVKYGFENGKVEVKIYNSDTNIYFEVCDNGPGIPEQEQKNIFQDFFRASNIRKMVSDGAGLGLSFVKQIIEKHNGVISFESPSRLKETNRPGVCFKISLPI
ncbi:MAG: HAMP domain-containing histidine kinase [Ignavibacterium sp.]|nr:HAMP domain-containing histidine kinase [Ignavibacterium sp.]MDW8375903.1 HAMP domain-containing sensor histidine kinase [Ignavibacteriales bacterium]